MQKGGQPPFNPVAMLKVRVVQAQHNLFDARTGFIIRDRLSWIRFFGFFLAGSMPYENTIPGGQDMFRDITYA
ncbi:transposase [Novosphingobium aquimarinum]|uniref:transposase n=1 Tax=Novosphingobium aquimarinum TaxID=2682494 RepID=UPI0012EC5FE9|nr:transposase [Novosphingobium aquimarinum]